MQRFDAFHWRAKTFPLLLLVTLIIILAVAYSFSDHSLHPFEGPGIALMILFMPITAITFLHYRLPKIQEEFSVIRNTLAGDADNTEMLSMISQEESGMDYVLPILFVCIFSALGFTMMFGNAGTVLLNAMDWVKGDITVLKDIKVGVLAAERDGTLGLSENFKRSVVAISMAFLGAYIWSIQYIFRRMMTLDLPPGAYYSVGSRMIYSAFLAVVFQYAVTVGEIKDFSASSQFIVISFLIGIFPERALAWMKDSTGRIFADHRDSSDELPLEMIEGISGFHKTRLSELGIDNVQNLAHASLLELILKTPFKPRVLVDWMAQARLCLEFKQHTKAIRQAGVRSILDLLEIDGDKALLAKVAENAGVQLSLIETICQANRDEISLKRLRSAYDKLNMV